MQALVYNFHQVGHVKPSTNRNQKFFFALDMRKGILIVTCTKLAKRKYFWNALTSFIFYSRFDGESYQAAGTSTYHHQNAGLANYLGKAFTTGCWASNPSLGGNCHYKTELMDMDTLTWSSGPDYPYSNLDFTPAQ